MLTLQVPPEAIYVRRNGAIHFGPDRRMNFLKHLRHRESVCGHHVLNFRILKPGKEYRVIHPIEQRAMETGHLLVDRVIETLEAIDVTIERRLSRYRQLVQQYRRELERTFAQSKV